MGKKDYPTTQETQDVIRGHESDIAKVKNCNPSYIYNIKNMEEPDPYSPFREWFSHCAYGGGKVKIYIADLQTIAHQAEFGVTHHGDLVNQCLNQINSKAYLIQKLSEMISDGQIDDRECEVILPLCDQIDSETKILREMVLEQRGRKALKVAK